MCNESNNDKLENLSAYKIFVGGIEHAHLLSVTDLIKVKKKEVIHKKKLNSHVSMSSLDSVLV